MRRGCCRPCADQTPPTLRALCIEIYARLASATEQATSARGSAGPDFQEGDEAERIELTYSTTASISQAGPAPATLIGGIIQVIPNIGQTRAFVGNVCR